MLHFDGIKQDFDAWERNGAVDWGYRHMEKYLNKIRHGIKDQECRTVCPIECKPKVDSEISFYYT